jgi:hypothetical protein
MRLLEFLSIVAFNPAIFSIIYLSEAISTVSFVKKEISLRREGGSRYPRYFHMLFERVYNSSEPRQSFDCCFFPFLSGDNVTNVEDILGLFLNLFENIVVLLF